MLVGPPDVPCARVVGIAADPRRGSLGDEQVFYFYVPAAQATEATGGPTTLLVRVAGDPQSVLPAPRAAVHAFDARVRYTEIRPLAYFLEPTTRQWRLGATLFTAFGLLALVVAAPRTRKAQRERRPEEET